MSVKISKKELLKMIKEAVEETHPMVGESDLVANSKGEWQQAKETFKMDVVDLLQNIENDNYDDAKNTIAKVMGVLNMWKERINKGGEKMSDAPFDFGFGGVLEGDKEK